MFGNDLLGAINFGMYSELLLYNRSISETTVYLLHLIVTPDIITTLEQL